MIQPTPFSIGEPTTRSPGGALNFVRAKSYAPKFRPLRSSFCSLHLPPAAVANEPVNSRATVNHSAERVQLGEPNKKTRPRKSVVCFLAPQVGLEPTTLRLTAACSTNCISMHQNYIGIKTSSLSPNRIHHLR